MYNFCTYWLQLKTEYITTHDAYLLVKEEIAYCEQYVTKSRQRLLQEFDKWYKESFIGQEDKNKPDEPPSEGTVFAEASNEPHDGLVVIHMYYVCAS